MQLFIVPVPVGNLKDITLRAIEVLKEVDFIIAEDTRYSRKLLSHLEIRKPMVSYYKHREQEKSKEILSRLTTQTAALITDSGTPLISDPGLILIQKAIEQQVEIVSLPGPTAFVPALAASGIPSEPFLFLGFPPRKKNDLKRFLTPLIHLPYTLIFYESPRRVEAFLRSVAELMEDREFVLAKEISKKHEKFIRGNLRDLDSILQPETLLGEMVVIIEGGEPQTSSKATPEINVLDDIYQYFKTQHNIPKNHIKNIIMKKK